MEYKYLKAFILTAKNLSFSKAADELKIAQSAVSRQIKLLEDSIGERLLVRSSKKVILTPAGKELFLIATQFDATTSALFKQSSPMTIRLGTLHGVTENWLLSIILDYCDQNKVNLEVHIDTPEKLAEGLSDGKFDLIFTNSDIQSETVTSLKLFREDLVFISKDELDTDELYDHRWIMYDKSDFFMQHYKKPKDNNYIFVNSITAMISLVKMGAGIALVPSHIIKNEDEIRHYPFPKSHDLHVYLSTINYDYYPKYLEILINQIKKSC